MINDLFDRILDNKGPLGKWASVAEGYFVFPKLEGPISNRMKFQGKEVITWSVNDYLGLANHPEVRETDANAAEQFGSAHPMGARMMSGHTDLHEQLEEELATFVNKEAAYVLNFGYQGILSTIDTLVSKNDIIVYDVDSHACIIDGVRLHQGKRFVFPHNNIENFEKQLQRANKITDETGGGILVITEGVFGMSGDLGKIREISTLKAKYNFRLFVDDAHGFGTMGETGYGTGEHLDCHEEIDVYFGTFAKSMASIGAFISSTEDVVEFLRYNMRSQIFAKSLPMPIVIGAIKRLELLQSKPELKGNLWNIANNLQSGLRKAGFNLGNTQSAVTPVYLSGGVGEATNLTLDLRENFGIFCSIVTYPVVPKGVILLRLIPTAIHTLEDVNYTIESFSAIKDKLENGEYISEKLASF